MAEGMQRLLSVSFGHAPLFERVRPSGDGNQEEASYLRVLRGELEPVVGAFELRKSEGRRRLEPGGATDLDVIQLFWTVTAGLTVYVTWKAALADVRSVIEKLRKLGDGRFVIDEPTAAWFAVAAVATPENFADIEVLWVASLRGGLDDWSTPTRGYLVGLSVSRATSQVVVLRDGTILRDGPGLDDDVWQRLKTDSGLAADLHLPSMVEGSDDDDDEDDRQDVKP